MNKINLWISNWGKVEMSDLETDVYKIIASDLKRFQPAYNLFFQRMEARGKRQHFETQSA